MRARVADAPLPASVRTWIDRSHESAARELHGRVTRQRRSRSTQARGGLEQRLAALEAENAALRKQVEKATTAPILELLNAGRVSEARQLVNLLLKASPSPKLEQWARVLAPPAVHAEPSATGGPIARNNAWLREHAREYVGRWVALRDGVLVGEDPSRADLHHRLQQAGQLDGVFFARL